MLRVLCPALLKDGWPTDYSQGNIFDTYKIYVRIVDKSRLCLQLRRTTLVHSAVFLKQLGFHTSNSNEIWKLYRKNLNPFNT